MCGCNPPVVPTNDMPGSLLSSSGNFDRESVILVTDPETKQQMVMVSYDGSHATITVNSRVDHRVSYRFGNYESKRVRRVLIDDVKYLLGLNNAGVPEFHLVSNIAVPETQDPAAFLGHPIVA